MPLKNGTAFLGLIVGGLTFFVTGLGLFLAINQVQDLNIVEARATPPPGMQVAHNAGTVPSIAR